MFWAWHVELQTRINRGDKRVCFQTYVRHLESKVYFFSVINNKLFTIKKFISQRNYQTKKSHGSPKVSSYNSWHKLSNMLLHLRYSKMDKNLSTAVIIIGHTRFLRNVYTNHDGLSNSII